VLLGIGVVLEDATASTLWKWSFYGYTEDVIWVSGSEVTSHMVLFLRAVWAVVVPALDVVIVVHEY
jgi:hypothetical protein